MRETPHAASLPAPYLKRHRRDSSQPAHPSGRSHRFQLRDPRPAPMPHQRRSTHRQDGRQRTSASGPIGFLQVGIIKQQLGGDLVQLWIRINASHGRKASPMQLARPDLRQGAPVRWRCRSLYAKLDHSRMYTVSSWRINASRCTFASTDAAAIERLSASP